MQEQEEQQPIEVIPEIANVAPEVEVPAEPNEELLPIQMSDEDLRAVVEAVIYITEEPLSLEMIATALQQDKARVEVVIASLIEDCNKPERGLIIKEVAGGYKMGTKPEHHDVIRQFVKNLKQPLKLSLAALETLAVIAYKQPITAPEIMEIRGVQGAGVLKTLLERKLIATSGRKNVVGKPILYKTTREFLVQFGLSGINELPTLKEFEELRRLSFDEEALDTPAKQFTLAEPVGEEVQAIAALVEPAIEVAESVAVEEATDKAAEEEDQAKAATEGNGQ